MALGKTQFMGLVLGWYQITTMCSIYVPFISSRIGLSLVQEFAQIQTRTATIVHVSYRKD